MRVNPLRVFRLPDVGDHLIHFTGRTGPKLALPDDLKGMHPSERLARILYEGMIRACATFGTGGRPIVSLTESSQASVLQLIREGRYGPWGVGFSKQFVFDQGGGPVLYVRGDEWDAATGVLPDAARARAVRFWPGASWEEGDPIQPDGAERLTDSLTTPSEWLHEREWRVPNDVVFGWDAVEFLIAPLADWAHREADRYREAYGQEYSMRFSEIPIVAIEPTGRLVRDDTGIWT